MAHPWLEIPISDYEAHMALRELLVAQGFSVVGQEQFDLASGKSFCRVVAKLA